MSVRERLGERLYSYSVREYGLALGAAIAAGVVLVLLLNAASGGPSSGSALQLRPEAARRPAAGLTAVEPAAASRATPDAASGADHDVAVRRRAVRRERARRAARRARSAPSPEPVATATPVGSTGPQTLDAQQPVAPAQQTQPQTVQAPKSAPRPAPTRDSGAGSPKKRSKITFDDSG